jgi:Leucine-rich repeat (LRR) protein
MNSIKYQSTDHKIILDRYRHNTNDINLTDKKIRKIIGIKGLPHLRYLNLYGNKLMMIHLESLINLQYLNLSKNRITETIGLENLTNLKDLHLSRNQITHMRGFDHLTNLEKLYLSGNQLTEITGLDNLANLKELYLNENQITCIKGLENLSHLEILDLSHNQIARIQGIDRLTHLRQLWLNGNKITHIEGLSNQTNLSFLCLFGNNISFIPMSIMLLGNLTEFYFDMMNNPIVDRLIKRNRLKNSIRHIYSDAQNVHNSEINRSITRSLHLIMEQKLEISEDHMMDEIINDSILSKPVKNALIEYVKISDVHSVLNVTFSEALQTVWQIIRSHELSEEIKRILNQEIEDSYCKCFTGRLSRLINCLNGFDPRVTVKISDQQEIANIIISIRQKYQKIDEQIDMVMRELVERGYDKQTIDEWLIYLE